MFLNHFKGLRGYARISPIGTAAEATLAAPATLATALGSLRRRHVLTTETPTGLRSALATRATILAAEVAPAHEASLLRSAFGAGTTLRRCEILTTEIAPTALTFSAGSTVLLLPEVLPAEAPATLESAALESLAAIAIVAAGKVTSAIVPVAAVPIVPAGKFAMAYGTVPAEIAIPVDAAWPRPTPFVVAPAAIQPKPV